MKQPRNDPVIDEVREVRRRISARFNHDPARLIAYYREFQDQYQDRLVTTTAQTPKGKKLGRPTQPSSARAKKRRPG
jgi:hypothetical protein